MQAITSFKWREREIELADADARVKQLISGLDTLNVCTSGVKCWFFPARMAFGLWNARVCRGASRKAKQENAPAAWSHIILKRANPAKRVVVPDHAALDKGTLRAIIREAGLTVEEFNALL